MSDPPNQEEAQRLLDMRPRPAWGYWMWSLVSGRASGDLMTAAEWRDSLESGHVISVAGHRKVKGPHDSQWELTGHSDMKWPLEYGKRFALVELPAAFGEQP